MISYHSNCFQMVINIPQVPIELHPPPPPHASGGESAQMIPPTKQQIHCGSYSSDMKIYECRTDLGNGCGWKGVRFFSTILPPSSPDSV